MPQMKARKTVESPRSRPRLHRRTRDIIPIDIDVDVTCNNAKITQTHLSSQQCISNAASTTHIDADTDAGARACTFTDVCDISHLPKPDPQLTKHAESESRLVPFTHNNNNVDAVMETPNYPVRSTAASCLPHQDMWRPCELAEQVEIPEGTFLERNECFFQNPHDMHVSVPNTQHAAKSLEEIRRAEERDKDVLQEYFQNPWNIVLHSDCPHIAPHIVITPAQETSEDFYTPWMNRTLAQWTGFLMVPPCNLSTGRLHIPNPPAELNILCPNGGTNMDGGSQVEDTPYSSDLPKRVFSHSQFNSFVEETANERLILYHVVKALQKHQCKAAAYAASARATEFCRRYEESDFLASIEKPFVWTDPAEPLLLSSRHMLGAMVLESSCPFIAPHIIINTPPPQDPWIPWYNAVNNPQDGHYLTVSPRVNYVNTDEEEEEEEEEDEEEGSLRMTSSATTRTLFFITEEEDEDEENFADSEAEEEDYSMVDHTESLPSSRPGSPGPETPTDDDSASIRGGFFTPRRSCFVIDEDDEDEKALALTIAKNAVEEYYQDSGSLLRVSLPVIEEEDSAVDDDGVAAFSVPFALPPLSPMYVIEEDGDLPPLDDWYLDIAARAMEPAVPVA